MASRTSGGTSFSSCVANTSSACTALGDVENQANQMKLATTAMNDEKQLASLSYRVAMLVLIPVEVALHDAISLGRHHDRGANLFDHLDQRIGIELLTK
jgi:hypothetical protein